MSARFPAFELDDVLALIGEHWDASKHEGPALDFKETPDTTLAASSQSRKTFLRELAEDAACIANTAGGRIVLGVRDRAVDRGSALAGVPSDYTPDDLKLAVYNNTDPPLTVGVEERHEDACRLLIVEVPMGAVVHSTRSGTYKWRVRGECRPIPPDVLRGLNAVRGAYDWSAELTELGPDALSAAALAAAAERLRRIGSDELAQQAETDREQFLRSCELTVDGRLRRAAVVMYGGEAALAALLPDWGMVLTTAASPGGEGAVILRREDGRRRPLVLLIEDALARLTAIARVETFRVGAGQVHLVDYPEDVLRELVANAFAHRDWERPGVIEVAHSPDELVVSSPGDLLPTLTESQLLRESAQRNRRLSVEVARLKITEGAGMGFDRVFRALASVGKDTPRFERGPRFAVVVPGGNGDRAFARYVNSPEFPEPRYASDLDVLLVLAQLRRRRSITAGVAAPLLQRDERSAEEVLRRMTTAGLTEPTRSSAARRRPSYRLSAATLAALRPSLAYRHASVDTDDAKLLRHLKRHRRIANEDVRGYLDCDVATARNRLTRLRRQGYIDFDPDGPRRGPGVEYVATALIDELDV